MDIERIMEIQKNTDYPNNKSVKEALLTVWRESVEQPKWKPISSAPRDGTFIMILMDSGYVSTPYSVVIASFNSGYSHDEGKDHRWRNHANDSIFDSYHKIIAWSKWNPPKIDFDPTEGMYTELKHGERVLVGDEILVEGKWVTISQGDIDSCRKITGVLFVCKEGKIRRMVIQD